MDYSILSKYQTPIIISNSVINIGHSPRSMPSNSDNPLKELLETFKEEEIEEENNNWVYWVLGGLALAALIYFLTRSKSVNATSLSLIEASISADTLPYTKNWDQNSPIKFSAKLKNNTDQEKRFYLWSEAGKYGQYFSNPTNGADILVPPGEEATAEWNLVVPLPPGSPDLPMNYKVVIGDPYGKYDDTKTVYAEKTGELVWPLQT